MKHTFKIAHRSIRFDFGFLLILLILFATSCFALYNAFNLIKTGSGSYYLNRQIMWYCAGFILMFFLSCLPNEKLFAWVDPVYKILLAVLLYLILSRYCYKFTGHALPLASSVNGAYSWIQLPFMSFQASEFMKVVLIIKTSRIIADFQKRHPKPTWRDDIAMLLEIAKWALLPMLLILIEPDTGVFIIIAFTLLMILICCGIRRVYIITIAILAAAAIGGFFLLYFKFPQVLESFMDSYQIARIDAWLNPDDYILGSSNQLYTALLSLGSAGLTGYGLQANIISIPEAHTDFIFAAFGQCFGLAGTFFIVALCMVLDIYICKLAYNCKNPANRLIMIGTVAMLFYQQLQNLGMIVGLFPITGITLPLISYGGSSTLSYFILFGIIMNVSPVHKSVHTLFSKIQKKLRTAPKKSKPRQSSQTA
jgi:rod shape determining protein RodA